MRERDVSDTLLAWYDRHARVLPWRVSPADRAAGVTPDPYAVWMSEIMLQQTTVAAVKEYFTRFMSLWPEVSDLAAAQDDRVMGEWAGLGYYARARNLLKCARAVTEDHGGHFPDTHAGLLSLPGIGPYTASAISAIAFDQPETVVDGNVERVMSRLNRVEIPLPKSKPVLTGMAATLTPKVRPGDYAQAVMDLGATVCTPRNPSCGICPLLDICAARKAGVAAELPRKEPKKAKPVRRGHIYLGRDTEGRFLIERRPDKGLLGGMLGWPGSDWTADPQPAPPAPADWDHLGEVRHTFTHFHLILEVHSAVVGGLPERGEWMDKRDLRRSDLPTVMRKAFDLAFATRES